MPGNMLYSFGLAEAPNVWRITPNSDVQRVTAACELSKSGGTARDSLYRLRKYSVCVQQQHKVDFYTFTISFVRYVLYPKCVNAIKPLQLFVVKDKCSVESVRYIASGYYIQIQTIFFGCWNLKLHFLTNFEYIFKWYFYCFLVCEGIYLFMQTK